ncbi:two-component system nitrogen regulation sensor histidine kinase NtrY [Loktanella ponticola]|uniref:histidine kinase n=1 Tax=Yoonia ponticola TaxID=1524255 RepID=A0A7W9BJU9_9RHOB|nr:two-component system nitrogen regulation sensor histidine kinase NtrY [Yoonia ponticola]
MQRTLLGIDFTRLSRLTRRRWVQNVLTLGLVTLGPVLAALTYYVLGPLNQGGASPTLRLVLLGDLVYILVVAVLVLRRVAQMIAARRAKSAGSRLHLRLTGVFGLLALIPTVLVAIFAMLSINLGLESWFSDRVRNVVSTSLSTAQAYEDEHKNELSRDGIGLAQYLNRERAGAFFMNQAETIQALRAVQVQIDRSLTEAFVIDSAGEIIARDENSYAFDFEKPTPAQFAEALETGIILIEDPANNEFRALIPLVSFVDAFLYITREVDGSVLALLDETKETYALYDQLENERGRWLFQFGLLYLGFAMILILAAIWFGLWFAERLARPVGRLVTASQRVGAGDLDVRVIEEDGDDEIAQLGHYFNQMTTQLKGQRDELLETNDAIERRRRLFDSVLSSVTSGVVGLSPDGEVTFVNKSAERLLAVDHNKPHGALAVTMPEFDPLFTQLVSGERAVVQEQVNLIRDGKQESLLVRMAPRRNEAGDLEGYVVAFDDVTDLVSAQRMAAWGDVARRIAHEIKNPLTPIQLSAERIKRKFRSQVGDDAEKLDQMTDVIVRQTNDLRRIVDEFSKFARMPEPELRENDLVSLVRDAVTLQEAGQPDVKIVADLPDEIVKADIDSTMISQALTNLIKNAGEAIESANENGEFTILHPEIRVMMMVAEDVCQITIQDNGIGLPEDRARLFEPYVTTRSKGTGLGLPIVKKIIEEHGGTLSLTDATIFDGHTHAGACAIITLPVAPIGALANKIPA